MPKVTIGVPVFNGAPYLARALEDLRTQSFEDIEVLIYDNASTDETARIALEFQSRDQRFHYFRQSENVGALRNFLDVLTASKSAYFMWRAMDDDATPNYIETLVQLLDESADHDLAVGRIETIDLDGRKLREARFPALFGNQGEFDRLRLLFNSHPSWIYGLFRREPLVARAQVVRDRYNHPWAWDHLTLFPFLFDFKVVGTDETACRQVLKRSSSEAVPRIKTTQHLATLVKLRRLFFAMTREDVNRRVANPLARAWYAVVLWFYVGKRVYRWRRAVRRALIDRLRSQPADGSAGDEKSGFESYY